MTRREKIQSIKEVTEIKDMLDNEYCDEEVIRYYYWIIKDTIEIYVSHNTLQMIP